MDNWGWFFGWVTVLAIVLAVPLSVAANLLTPKLQAWWATTSERRRVKRLSKLNAAIEDIPRFRSAVYRQEKFLAGMRYLTIGLVSLTAMLMLTLSIVITTSASFDHVTPIFPGGTKFTLSSVALHRFESVYSVFVLLFATMTFNRAYLCFKSSSRYYAERKLDDAAKELKRLVRYSADKSGPPTSDKPDSPN